MSMRLGRLAAVFIVAACATAQLWLTAASAEAQSKTKANPQEAARGKYLAILGGCMDCHTPGYFLGKPDMARYLAGSDVGLEIPGLGVFHGPNLTPDKVPGPFGPSEKPTSFVMTVVPPQVK